MPTNHGRWHRALAQTWLAFGLNPDQVRGLEYAQILRAFDIVLKIVYLLGRY